MCNNNICTSNVYIIQFMILFGCGNIWYVYMIWFIIWETSKVVCLSATGRVACICILIFVNSIGFVAINYRVEKKKEKERINTSVSEWILILKNQSIN